MDLPSARRLMGDNIFGPEEIEQGFGITLSERQRKKADHIPFSKAILEKCAQSHMLVLGVPKDNRRRKVTISYFRKIAKEQCWRFISLFERDSADFIYQGSWSHFERLANKRTCKSRWYLIPKSILAASKNKTFDIASSMVRDFEEIEYAIVYVYAMLLHSRIHGYDYGTTPFSQEAVWCKDIESHGQRVYAGSFGYSGSTIGCYLPNVRLPKLGVAPCVRLS